MFCHFHRGFFCPHKYWIMWLVVLIMHSIFWICTSFCNEHVTLSLLYIFSHVLTNIELFDFCCYRNSVHYQGRDIKKKKKNTFFFENVENVIMNMWHCYCCLFSQTSSQIWNFVTFVVIVIPSITRFHQGGGIKKMNMWHCRFCIFCHISSQILNFVTFVVIVIPSITKIASRVF